jgi:hypothetical protein
MPQSGAQRLVELEGRVATLEKELLEVRIGIGRLLRKYTQVQRRYLRLRALRPDGRVWERGSTLRVPPRPTKLLRAMGLLGDAK